MNGLLKDGEAGSEGLEDLMRADNFIVSVLELGQLVEGGRKEQLDHAQIVVFLAYRCLFQVVYEGRSFLFRHLRAQNQWTSLLISEEQSGDEFRSRIRNMETPVFVNDHSLHALLITFTIWSNF